MQYALLAAALIAVLLVLRGVRAARRRAYLEHFDFAGLLDARLARRRPELDEDGRTMVFDGLRDWFWACSRAHGRKLSMPSQVVDDAWHEFILFTRNYQDFCSRALGRFLHHVPAEAMSSPTQAEAGLRRSWRLACRRANIDPKKPATLPLLFAIDADLAIADGFRYQLNCLKQGAATSAPYCASHIGCSGCSSGCGSGDSGDGGCGGD